MYLFFKVELKNIDFVTIQLKKKNCSLMFYRRISINQVKTTKCNHLINN